MKVIVGHTKRPRRKWPYAFFMLAIICSIAAVILLGSIFVDRQKVGEEISRPKERVEIPPSKNAEITVEKMVFTKKVDSENHPTDNFVEIEKEKIGIVYCYTRVSSSVLPQPVRHVWISPSGGNVADIKLFLSNRPAHTWSYINLSGAQSGKWEVQVRKLNNELIAKHDLLLY